MTTNATTAASARTLRREIQNATIERQERIDAGDEAGRGKCDRWILALRLQLATTKDGAS